MITIFTDGSSRGNPGPGGWGALLVVGSELISPVSQIVELGGNEATTTNNRMEIMAAIGALNKVSESFGNVPNASEIVIYTDSAYLINGITKWVKGWQVKGWMTLQKQPVVNKDLWEKLITLTAGKHISWKKVGGHVGTVGNERCDVIATMCADKKDPNLFVGVYTDYSIKNILEISEDTDAAEKKSSTKSHTNAKAYSYVSLVGGVVKTHATWAECEARVKGKPGVRFKKSVDSTNEKEIIADFSGRSR